MSATQIIAEIESLPREEQEKVFAFVQDKTSERQNGSNPEVKYADDAKFEAAAAKVFSENDGLFRRLAQ